MDFDGELGCKARKEAHMSAWWTLTIDQGADGTGGVTQHYCGYMFHGREEFPSVEEARLHALCLINDGGEREYREIHDLTLGETFSGFGQESSRDDFMSSHLRYLWQHHQVHGGLAR